MSSLVLIPIQILILITFNRMNCFCEINNKNESQIQNYNTTQAMTAFQLNSDNNTISFNNSTNYLLTNGFLLRTLFVVKQIKKFFK